MDTPISQILTNLAGVTSVWDTGILVQDIWTLPGSMYEMPDNNYNRIEKTD